MDFLLVPLLSPEEVERFVAGLASATFADGGATASGAAKSVKKNLQVPRSGMESGPLDELFFQALRRNQEFQRFAVPKRVLPPTYSRYEPGMHYGSHVDGAIMGSPHPLRTDLAMTLFLCPPHSYDGGELVIEMGFGEQEIKLDAGEAVVYPATTMHRVAPVTRGVRMVAVSWIQSAVADDRLRSILSDLSKATDQAEAAGDKHLLTTLSKCYHNLLRYAAQP